MCTVQPMMKGGKGARLTVPELAKTLGVSDQTVRRWVRRKLVPFSKNAEGWALIRVEDVPADLLEATKKLSSARYRQTELQTDPHEEIRYLRERLEQAMGIIATLSDGDEGVTPLSNGNAGA